MGRDLLLILLAIAVAVIGARLDRPAPSTTGSTHASQGSIGARNHSGIEPIDVFDLRQRGW